MTERKTQITFSVNRRTLELIEKLKDAFEVETNTQALKRALAIARIAVENQKDDHTITLIGKDEVRKDIVLNA